MWIPSVHSAPTTRPPRVCWTTLNGHCALCPLDCFRTQYSQAEHQHHCSRAITHIAHLHTCCDSSNSERPPSRRITSPARAAITTHTVARRRTQNCKSASSRRACLESTVSTGPIPSDFPLMQRALFSQASVMPPSRWSPYLLGQALHPMLITDGESRLAVCPTKQCVLLQRQQKQHAPHQRRQRVTSSAGRGNWRNSLSSAPTFCMQHNCARNVMLYLAAVLLLQCAANMACVSLPSGSAIRT